MSKHGAGTQAIAAIGALAVGVWVYLVERDPQRVYLLAGFIPESLPSPLHLGTIAGVLPEFIHVYAFSLLTALLLPSTPRHTLGACLAWFVVDSAFEIAQHPAIAPMIVAVLPGWFEQVPLLDNTVAYFRHGTFDPLDLAAVAVGAQAAWLTIVYSQRRRPWRTSISRSH